LSRPLAASYFRHGLVNSTPAIDLGETRLTAAEDSPPLTLRGRLPAVRAREAQYENHYENHYTYQRAIRGRIVRASRVTMLQPTVYQTAI
jgi:hypothetical protein